MAEKTIDKTKLPNANDYSRQDGVCQILMARCMSDCRQCNVQMAFFISRELNKMGYMLDKIANDEKTCDCGCESDECECKDRCMEEEERAAQEQ